MRRLRKQDVAVLERMRELIQRGWSLGAEARTGRREVTFPLGKDAARFCLLGAYRRARHDLALVPYENDTVVLMELAEAVRGRIGNDWFTSGLSSRCAIAWFNDRQVNKKLVLALIDRVLARARK